MSSRGTMRFALVAALLFATGCASVPRDGGFDEVRQTVLDRGRYDIEWRRGPADEARLRELLATELDAERAVAVALANNPRLQVILTGLGVARADLLDASTISNPVLELEWRSPGDPYNPYEITIAQSILDLVQLPRRRAAGRAAFEAAKSRVAAEVLRFASHVRDDYYRLIAATQKLAFSRTATEAAKVSAELAVRQHTAGNITDLALEQEQAAYERAKVALSRDEEAVIVAREALIRDMGLRDDAIEWSVQPDFPPLPERELEAGEIESQLATRRLDLIVASRELEATRKLLGISRLEEIGEVVVDFHVEREPSGERTKGPGIEFPIPIFNRGAARRARALAELSSAERELDAMMVSAASEVREARQRMLAARARAEYYRDVIVPRQVRIVELTKLEHNAMLLGVYRLLQARQTETEARREYADAQMEYWMARAGFERALHGIGGGDSFHAGGEGTRRPRAAREEGH